MCSIQFYHQQNYLCACLILAGQYDRTTQVVLIRQILPVQPESLA